MLISQLGPRVAARILGLEGEEEASGQTIFTSQRSLVSL